MKLSAPKQVTFWVAVVVAVLGLIVHLMPTLPVIGGSGFWLLLLGFVILAIANLLEGL
jgi:membrane-bound ClpP family serine protease